MSLADYVDAARRRVASGFYEHEQEPLRPHGSLAQALDGRARILAELKPRAPSTGRLLRGDPQDVLHAYSRGGAAGISVLTDGDHFDGAPALLRQAHGQGLPTMLKDFVVDVSQIACAAHHGASAVLLIERILRPRERDDLIAAAHDHGLEVLLEVHAGDGMDGALGSDADMVGVNARDLDTLAIDTDAARRIIEDVADAGRHAVALSGVLDRRDRVMAEQAGARGCLVGTHLMRQRDPALALTALRRPLAKVCGITDTDALEAAQQADLVGLVVAAPSSPRCLDPASCSTLVASALEQGNRPVLVTKEAVEDVARLAVDAGAAYVQASAFEDSVRGRLETAGIGCFQVVGPGDAATETMDGLVVDTPSEQGGGSGRTHDWRASARTVAKARGRLTLIAGGLDAKNAADALFASGAWGADASSGLEAKPGVKDPDAVRAFIAAVHGAEERNRQARPDRGDRQRAP